MKQSEEQENNEKVTSMIKSTEEIVQKNNVSEDDENKIGDAKESDRDGERDGSDVKDKKEGGSIKEEKEDSDIEKEKENSDIKKGEKDSDIEEKKESNNKEFKKENEDKKVYKNNKDHGSDENDSEDESDEPLGLLDGPVKIVSGSRERKKVERFEIIVKTPKDNKFEIFEGTGKKFRDIPSIEDNISKMKAAELQVLHKILYGSKGILKTVKKHLREFSGFPDDISDSDKLSKQKYMTNLYKNDLNGVCKILCLEKKGTKDEVIGRVMEFLLEPKDHHKKIPEKRRSKSLGKSKKGKRKSDVKKSVSTKKKGKALPETNSEKEEEQDDDIVLSDSKDSDKDEDDDNKKLKSTPKKRTKKKAKSLPEIDSEKEEEDDKMDTSDIKDSDKDEDSEKDDDNDNKKSKSTPKNKEKKSKLATKEKPKKGNVKGTKRKQASSDNEEPPAKKRKLPSDKQLTKLVEGILKNADLQEVTMKNVIQQVFDTYPGCDLSHKKSFIKETIKTVISA